MKILKLKTYTPDEKMPNLYEPIIFHIGYFIHAGAYIGNGKWRVNNSFQEQTYHYVEWWAKNDNGEFEYEN